MDRLRVLFVDDEEELVSTLVRRLTMRGIDAEYVLSGEEALKAVHDKDFDLVIMDFRLGYIPSTKQTAKEELPASL